MTQLPIINGIKASAKAGFDVEYPTNAEPIPVDTNISKGFLRTPPGTVGIGTGPDIDRGGINWNGVLYRVMGDRLVSVSALGVVTDLGEVADDGLPVSLHYSFTDLSIGSGQNLYYWNPTDGLRRVTDEDLGPVLDHIFVSGYFMTTDGENIVVTELDDPLAVDPLKYGASETDPDPVTGLILIEPGNEVYALNRYTIDPFQNVGGNGFPFALVNGGTIPKGCVSQSAKCHFLESFAFVGSGNNEALGVYIAASGSATKISTRTIDKILAMVTDPTQIICESVVYDDEQRLLVHLPDQTLIFCAQASALVGEKVWYYRKAGSGRALRPRFHVNVYDGWYVGDHDAPNIGKLDFAISTDYGEENEGLFTTYLVYNEGKGAICHSLELAGQPGRVPFGKQGTVFISRSLDGEEWGEERSVSTGKAGQRDKRVQLRPHWKLHNYMALRFRWLDSSIATWARLEAEFEGLSV